MAQSTWTNTHFFPLGTAWWLYELEIADDYQAVQRLLFSIHLWIKIRNRLYLSLIRISCILSLEGESDTHIHEGKSVRMVGLGIPGSPEHEEGTLFRNRFVQYFAVVRVCCYLFCDKSNGKYKISQLLFISFHVYSHTVFLWKGYKSQQRK